MNFAERIYPERADPPSGKIEKLLTELRYRFGRVERSRRDSAIVAEWMHLREPFTAFPMTICARAPGRSGRS